MNCLEMTATVQGYWKMGKSGEYSAPERST